MSCPQAPPAKYTSIPALCPPHCPSLAQDPVSLARTATVAPTTATAFALSPCRPSFLWQREGSCEDQGGPIPSLLCHSRGQVLTPDLCPTPRLRPSLHSVTLALLFLHHIRTAVPPPGLPPSPPATLGPRVTSRAPHPGPVWCCIPESRCRVPALFQCQHSRHPTGCIFHSLSLFVASPRPPECQRHEGRFLFP